jgi:hypothetical protein
MNSRRLAASAAASLVLAFRDARRRRRHHPGGKCNNNFVKNETAPVNFSQTWLGNPAGAFWRQGGHP